MPDSTDLGCADVRTDDGLRQALKQIPHEGGWNSALGGSVIAALTAVSSRWTRRHADIVDEHRERHLIGVAWEFIATHVDDIVDARSPWALVHAHMRHCAAAEVVADELCTSTRHARLLIDARVRARMATTHTAVRVHDSALFDVIGAEPHRHEAKGAAATGEVVVDDQREWDEALWLLYHELVAAGAPPAHTAEAIVAVLDAVSTAASRSKMHTGVYQSSHLAEWTHAQRRALTALLIGTRRGGPESSTWLALRRDLADGSQPRVHVQLASRVAEFVAPYRQTTRQRTATRHGQRRAGESSPATRTGAGASALCGSAAGSRSQRPGRRM